MITIDAEDRRIVVDASGRIHVVELARHIQKVVKRTEEGFTVEIAVSGWNRGGYDSFKVRKAAHGAGKILTGRAV